ncbi:MAG: hypothetical protein ACK47H_10345, partial [Akkermansiaceae bacterium]
MPHTRKPNLKINCVAIYLRQGPLFVRHSSQSDVGYLKVHIYRCFIPHRTLSLDNRRTIWTRWDTRPCHKKRQPPIPESCRGIFYKVNLVTTSAAATLLTTIIAAAITAAAV